MPIIPVLGIVTTIILKTEPILALEPTKIFAKAQEFTVRIDGEETGTGTIIKRNGDSYSVITCWHVVDTPGDYQVITPDDNSYQVTTIKNLPNVDIAIITFRSGNTYPIAELGDSTRATPGLDTYIVGYPDPFPGNPERQYFTESAQVQSRLSQAEEGYQIIHSGSFTPGASGGGIFDQEARLLGINGQNISEGNTGKAYGRGIPLEAYLSAQNSLTIPRRSTVQVATQDSNLAAQNNLTLPRKRNDTFVLFFPVRSCEELEECERVITDYNQAILLDSENAELYISRASAFKQLGDRQQALRDLLKSANLFKLQGNLKAYQQVIELIDNY